MSFWPMVHWKIPLSHPTIPDEHISIFIPKFCTRFCHKFECYAVSPNTRKERPSSVWNWCNQSWTQAQSPKSKIHRAERIQMESGVLFNKVNYRSHNNTLNLASKVSSDRKSGESQTAPSNSLIDGTVLKNGWKNRTTLLSISKSMSHDYIQYRLQEYSGS